VHFAIAQLLVVQIGLLSAVASELLNALQLLAFAFALQDFLLKRLRSVDVFMQVVI